MKTPAPSHRHGKSVLAAFWHQRQFAVVHEPGCDVYAFRCHDGLMEDVFSEYERSTRNVLRNCQRNLVQRSIGRSRYLIAVPDERLRSAVRALLRRYLPPELARKFAIVLIESLERRLTTPLTDHARQDAKTLHDPPPDLWLRQQSSAVWR